jgi:hypothetical protein
MVGTFGGALEARQIDASNGKLTADVTGEVETEEGVLVIRRIHVAMHLVAAEAARKTVERAHGFYATRCPLYYQKNRCADLRKENHRLKNMFSEPNVSAVAGSFFMHQRRDKEYGPQISDSVR